MCRLPSASILKTRPHCEKTNMNFGVSVQLRKWTIFSHMNMPCPKDRARLCERTKMLRDSLQPGKQLIVAPRVL